MVRNGKRVWMFNDQGELIIAALSPDGFEEISRAKLIEPTAGQFSGTWSSVVTDDSGPPAPGDTSRAVTNATGVTWSHPAYANKHVFVRNDNQLVCANLTAP
jgi:hypothetical protein